MARGNFESTSTAASRLALRPANKIKNGKVYMKALAVLFYLFTFWKVGGHVEFAW